MELSVNSKGTPQYSSPKASGGSGRGVALGDDSDEEVWPFGRGRGKKKRGKKKKGKNK